MNSKKRKHEEKDDEVVEDREDVCSYEVTFELPRSSSKWQRSEMPLWEKFGIELQDIHADKTLKSVCLCELKGRSRTVGKVCCSSLNTLNDFRPSSSTILLQTTVLNF